MKFIDQEQVQAENVKVVPLFGKLHEEIIHSDPLADLLQEGLLEDEVLEPEMVKARRIAGEDLFPDQSLYILEEQLRDLKKNLNRIKFYLGEIEDIIPG